MADDQDDEIAKIPVLEATIRFQEEPVRKRLCAVSRCSKTSDGKRSNYMCKRHYSRWLELREDDRPDDEEETATDAAAEDDEEMDQGDDDEASKQTKEGEKDAGSVQSSKMAASAADDDDTGGGRRSSRRNRKPSAKVVAAAKDEIEFQKALKKQRDAERSKGSSKGGGASASGAKRTVHASGEDDGSDSIREQKKSKVSSASRAHPAVGMGHPSYGRAYPPSIFSMQPKRPQSPEPSFLFRQGPIPPPSPPMEPRSGPPVFSLPNRDGQKQDRAGHGSRPVREHPYVANGIHPDIAGVYAPLIHLRTQRDVDTTGIVPLPSRTVGGLRDQIEKTKQCNCRKSNCLKLYCECFASAIHCNAACNCVQCQNNEHSTENIKNRSRMIVGMLERNPNAFRPRPLAAAGAAATAAAGIGASDTKNKLTRGSTKGCNCKKSFCLKKYCECFGASIYCNPGTCRCVQCQNTPGNLEREDLIRKRQLAAEKSAQVAAAPPPQQTIRRKAEDGGARVVSNGVGGGLKQKSDGAVAAAALAATGVDVFLPPSLYAVPMKIDQGIEIPGLGFGTAGKSKGKGAGHRGARSKASKKKAKAPTRNANGTALIETGCERDARLATEGLELKLKSLHENYSALMKWNSEKEAYKTEVARGAQLASNNSKKVCQAAGVSEDGLEQHFEEIQKKKGRTPVFSSNDHSALALGVTGTLEYVDNGISRIKMAADRAKDRANEYIANKDGDSKNMTLATTSDEDVEMKEVNDPELDVLLCKETMPRMVQTQGTVSNAERELFVLAAQDAALMQELAKVIREKALELGVKRIGRAAEAAGKARSSAEAIMRKKY